MNNQAGSDQLFEEIKKSGLFFDNAAGKKSGERRIRGL
jgi:hypothetical protein